VTVYGSQSRTSRFNFISHCFCIWEVCWLWSQTDLPLCNIFYLLIKHAPSTYLCRGYRTSSSTRYLSTLSTCSFMGTGSVLKNEHFTVCFMLKGIKFRHFRSPSKFVFLLQLSNRLASFNENCYEFFTFGKYPNLVRTLLFWVITQRVVVTSYGRFGTTYRSRLHVSGIQKVFYSCLLKMGPLVYPETSVRNDHYLLRNNPEERGGSLQSSTQIPYFFISLINV